MNGVFEPIRRLWLGCLPLADAFWTWAVLGGLVVNLASSALCLWLVVVDRPVVALAVGYLPSVPYNVVVCVGVWRAAARYQGPREWANLARAVTLVAMLVFSLT